MSSIAQERGTVALPELAETREIPRPTDVREPMKVSIYERASKQTAQLVPIFPYDDAGAIVPCAAIMWGGRAHGQYFHWNTVSEVVVTWGSNEAMLATGQIMATQKFHGVNSFLKDENNPDAFVLVTVTQHQSTEAGQKEAMVAKCESCKKEMIRHEYDAGPVGAPDFDPFRFGKPDDVFHQFSTQVGSSEFAEIRNSAEGKVCPHCGHENSLLPWEPWNWSRLVKQTQLVNEAYHALTSLAEEEQAA
jgi:hypothetical protein